MEELRIKLWNLLEQELFRLKGKNVDAKPLTCPNVIAYKT
jgi:hypothetical protein